MIVRDPAWRRTCTYRLGSVPTARARPEVEIQRRVCEADKQEPARRSTPMSSMSGQADELGRARFDI